MAEWRRRDEERRQRDEANNIIRERNAAIERQRMEREYFYRAIFISFDVAYGGYVFAYNAWNLLINSNPSLHIISVKRMFILLSILLIAGGVNRCFILPSRAPTVTTSIAMLKAAYTSCFRWINTFFVLITSVNLALKMIPLRNDYYFFPRPFSIIEDLWLLVILTNQTIKRNNYIFITRFIQTICFLQIIIPLIYPHPIQTIGIHFIDDVRIIPVIIPIFILNYGVNSMKNYMARRDITLFPPLEYNGRELEFIPFSIVVLASIGVADTFSSQPWYVALRYVVIPCVIALFGTFLCLYDRSGVMYVLFSVVFFATLAPCMIIGVIKCINILDHVRHAVYIRYLQQYIAPIVIHIVDLISCFVLPRMIVEGRNGGNMMTIAFVTLKIIDLYRRLLQYIWRSAGAMFTLIYQYFSGGAILTMFIVLATFMLTLKMIYR